MDISERDNKLFGPDELGAVFQHQLRSPIDADLESPVDAAAESDQSPTARTSFADVLLDPHPPIHQLEAIKQFAKSKRTQPDSNLPPEVATVLYYASIAAALVRCGQRITELDDAALQRGFQWACDQAWIDSDTRALCEQGLQALRTSSDAGPVA